MEAITAALQRSFEQELGPGAPGSAVGLVPSVFQGRVASAPDIALAASGRVIPHVRAALRSAIKDLHQSTVSAVVSRGGAFKSRSTRAGSVDLPASVTSIHVRQPVVTGPVELVRSAVVAIMGDINAFSVGLRLPSNAPRAVPEESTFELTGKHAAPQATSGLWSHLILAYDKHWLTNPWGGGCRHCGGGYSGSARHPQGAGSTEQVNRGGPGIP